MSYGFDMGFAQANSLQEAMTIALEYTQSQMTEKNIRKTIRDNRYYIPSIRTGYIADEESKNRRADVLADTADKGTEEEQVRYVMNHLCPNLYHFYKNPTQKDFRLGPDVVNLMVHQHMCENTQATILNEEGSLFQDGVHDTHEEILLLTLFFEHEFNDMDIRCARVSYTSSDAEIKACFLHAVHKRFGLMDPAAERLWLSNKSNKVYLIKTIHGIA